MLFYDSIFITCSFVLLLLLDPRQVPLHTTADVQRALRPSLDPLDPSFPALSAALGPLPADAALLGRALLAGCTEAQRAELQAAFPPDDHPALWASEEQFEVHQELDALPEVLPIFFIAPTPAPLVQTSSEANGIKPALLFISHSRPHTCAVQPQQQQTSHEK